MKLTLHVWRQESPSAKGGFETYHFDDDRVNGDTSFLEMMDLLNEELIADDKIPIAFDSDCREGICGACSMVINGHPHGPDQHCTTCETRMRAYKDGEELWIEPFRAAAMPIVKDLIVDRSSLDRVIQSGGYVTVHSGPKPDPNTMPISHDISERAMDAAECIGCGACVAACPNASAMLFTSAKVAHLGLLPQGVPEHVTRVRKMVAQMDEEGFGACTNYAQCQAACPKEISIQFIARMNREFRQATLNEPLKTRGTMRQQ
jgi:succinate dehydrogenase / fumarate reductase iron-sulfur subunit